jgi:hypothetical protein
MTLAQQKVAALVLVLFSSRLAAQPTRSDPVDVQSRVGIQLKMNLPKKWEGSLGYEARMVSDASEYHGSYFDGELGRTLGKHLMLFTNYRFASVADAHSHRFGFGAEAERKTAHFTVSFRPMFQYQHSLFDDAEQGSSDALRTRLRVKKPFGERLTLYGSSEPYFAFTGIYPVDNWRNTVGMQWAFMKKRKMDVYYIYRPDYSKPTYNRTYHIVGAELSAEVSYPKGKKKKNGIGQANHGNSGND